MLCQSQNWLGIIVNKCTGQIVEFTIFRICLHNIVTVYVTHFVVALPVNGRLKSNASHSFYVTLLAACSSRLLIDLCYLMNVNQDTKAEKFFKAAERNILLLHFELSVFKRKQAQGNQNK